MPTPDEQQLVPSLGVESDTLDQSIAEGVEGNTYSEGQPTSESQVSNRPVETLLGEAPPSAAVDLNLKFRQSMQPIPRAEPSQEAGEGAGLPQEIQRIKANARMDGLPEEPQPAENTQPEAVEYHSNNSEQSRQANVEAYFGSSRTPEATPLPEHSSQMPTPPDQVSNNVAPDTHNHSEHMAADPEALDRHNHAGQELDLSTVTGGADVPSDPESAHYASHLQAELEAGQAARLQQAA